MSLLTRTSVAGRRVTVECSVGLLADRCWFWCADGIVKHGPFLTLAAVIADAQEHYGTEVIVSYSGEAEARRLTAPREEEVPRYRIAKNPWNLRSLPWRDAIGIEEFYASDIEAPGTVPSLLCWFTRGGDQQELAQRVVDLLNAALAAPAQAADRDAGNVAPIEQRYVTKPIEASR